MSHSKIGNLYIIQEREFIDKNECIYKMGRTGNLAKRICDYPKGSIVHFAIHSKNLIYDENKVYNIFCTKFKARPDIGKEYFEGNIRDMSDTISKYIYEDAILPVKTMEDQKEEENIKIEQKFIKKDITIVIMEFLDIHRIEFSEKIIKSKDVYQKLIDWVEIKKYNIFISHTKMTRDLIKIYNITAKTHRFEDGVDQALIFPHLLNIEIVKNSENINVDPILKFFAYFVEKNVHKKDSIITTNELYNNFISFIRDHLKLKEEVINVFTMRILSCQINKKYCNSDLITTGIIRKLNIGKNCQNGFNINLNHLKAYLESKGLNINICQV
jgi:hypothetical protein